MPPAPSHLPPRTFLPAQASPASLSASFQTSLLPLPPHYTPVSFSCPSPLRPFPFTSLYIHLLLFAMPLESAKLKPLRSFPLTTPALPPYQRIPPLPHGSMNISHPPPSPSHQTLPTGLMTIPTPANSGVSPPPGFPFIPLVRSLAPAFLESSQPSSHLFPYFSSTYSRFPFTRPSPPPPATHYIFPVYPPRR